MPYIFDKVRALRQKARGENRRMATPRQNRGEMGRQQMARLLKLVVVLAILGFGALVGYAYLGDLTPATEEIRQPVTLDAG